ncbi:DeoR/GlpR family DNA-binding transcription regulator [Massilia sp. TWP1-3-3]|uniref:DeoR/GlpR family DNA-binding transcription regulator n=2 Tax=unclassified Massilia TaxID=2609279 RepID=UPI003CEC7E9D
MLTSQRKREILDTLAHDGHLIAKALSERFAVSEDTIRRDLRELAAEGLLQRVHGGALPSSPAVANLTLRENLSSPAKERIARAAAQLVAPGHTIIVDGGTTSIQLVRCLPKSLTATVVTHSPHVAVALADHLDIEVILIGGRLFRHSMVTVGAAAIEALRHIRADMYFMGVTGVHLRAGLSTGDLEEAYMKRALASQAAETIVLASHEKINAASRCKIGDLGLANSIVLERESPPAFIDALERLNITVVRS